MIRLKESYEVLDVKDGEKKTDLIKRETILIN